MNTADQTYAEQRDAYVAEKAPGLPAETIAAFVAEQVALDAAGVPAAVLGLGAVLPDGDLLDVHGRITTLEHERAGRAAVVVFYRGDWCPYCNLVLRTYQRQLLPALSTLDVPLIAISPQKPDRSLSMRDINELAYTVLSDPGNQIARRLGILTAPSDDARAAQLTLGIDVAAGNADGTIALPMPTVVVVGLDGLIAWIDVHPDYSTRTEVPDILTAIAKILGQPIPAQV